MAARSTPQSRIVLKITVLGDSAIGKTTMLDTYLKPTVIDGIPTAYHAGFTQNIDLDGEYFLVTFVEIPSHDAHAQTRPLNYVDVDAAICCFSCLNPPSQKAVSNKWVTEMSQAGCLPNLLLVGTMTEYRDDEESIAKTLQQFGQAPLKEHDGLSLSEFIRAKYIEVATKDEESVKQVFEEAIRLAYRSYLERPQASSKLSKCSIM